MKIVISHDVDHITFSEHNKDLIVPKHIVRGFIELGFGYISISETVGRIKSIVQNKWQNLEKLMQFDRESSVHSTYFFGVSKGKGLTYSKEDARFWIRKTLQEGFDVGVHGIAFDNYDDIKDEYETFRKLSGIEKFGIRMHYLRNTNNTLPFLNKAGYVFDTTLYKFEDPFNVGELWEFPLHIMDCSIICKNSPWQNQNLEQAKEATKRVIENCFNMSLKYFTILFHDNYFCNSFNTWKMWYIWLIEYLKQNKFVFINYHEAIRELGGDNVG
ncbi:MAG: hypothetical protein MRK01_15965 [Candidatus Scalindua sp.]|nr:hypothetical protein [Candidatus Scalindua sp.]